MNIRTAIDCCIGEKHTTAIKFVGGKYLFGICWYDSISIPIMNRSRKRLVNQMYLRCLRKVIDINIVEYYTTVKQWIII